MNVLIDTNVLLDVIGRREPFYRESVAVWSMAEAKTIDGFISAVSYNNTFYIVRRKRDLPTARKAMLLLRDTFQTVPLDQQVINQAIDSAIRDFEDAVQYFSAQRAQCETLITRNPGHFKRTAIPALTPREFLASDGA